MDDEPTTPAPTGRVSFDKRAADTEAASGRVTFSGGVGRGRPNAAADGSPMPAPPKQVRYAVVALVVSSIAALAASLSLFGEKDWLFREGVKTNNDRKVGDRKTVTELHHAVDSTTSTYLISTLVLILALIFAARGVWRGRHWARWTVIGLWILATFTGTVAGFTSVIGIASGEPVAFKVPTFISATALIVAVVMVSLRPSAEYFALTRPPRPDGAAGGPRRGGLFGPRPARPGFATPGTAAAAPRGSAKTVTTERSRAKQRASTESVAKGAELARARAKASKSRRSGV